MAIQLRRYFRMLVIGEENRLGADIIEKDLGFRTRLVSDDQVAEAIRGSADCGTIVVSREQAKAAAVEDGRIRLHTYVAKE